MTEIIGIENLLISVTSGIAKEYDKSKIQILDRGVPHVPPTPKNLHGYMGIYMFEYENSFLKIGKVGNKSKERFCYQHYKPNSCNSNLSLDILADSSMQLLNLNASNVGDWLKNNTRRIDILIDETLGIFALNFYEASLHYKYHPKYEGFKSQKR